MKANFIVAALAAFAVSAVTMVATTGPANAKEWRLGGACSSSYRQHHRSAGCLHAWWDNSPPPSTGVVGGSTYGARSYCGDYGTVIAHIDLRGGLDENFLLNRGGRIRGRSGTNKVRNISCCMNESDLCHKQQVEARNGIIKVYTGSGTTTRDVDVSTHAKRYEFCQDNEDTIYCEVDPEGDAFTTPDPPTCEDDPSACTVDDCRDNWGQSEASEESSIYLSHASLSGSGSDRQCRLLVRKRNYGTIVTLFAAVAEVDQIIYCGDNDEFVQVGGSC